MAFNDLNLIRSLKGETYGDLLSVRWYSGSSIASPTSLTLPGLGSVLDPFGRTSIAQTTYGIVSGSMVISGTWADSSTIDRRAFPGGMIEEADAVFVCYDDYFQVLSGARIFGVKEGIEWELVRMITGLTTGEVFTAWRKQRYER